MGWDQTRRTSTPPTAQVSPVARPVGSHEIQAVDALAAIAGRDEPDRVVETNACPGRAHLCRVVGADGDPGDAGHDLGVGVSRPRSGPGPRSVRDRLVDRHDRPTDVAGMEVAGADIRPVNAPDGPDSSFLELAEPVVDVVDLEDRHVAAISGATIEQPAGSRPLLCRRDHFEELVADRHQGVVQAECGDAGVAEADVQPKPLAEGLDNRVEFASHEGHLSQSDHVENLTMPLRTAMIGAMFLGDDLLAWLVLALGGALLVGNVAAIVRPPERPLEEGALERAPVARSVIMAVVGLVAAVWALASLLAG